MHCLTNCLALITSSFGWKRRYGGSRIRASWMSPNCTRCNDLPGELSGPVGADNHEDGESVPMPITPRLQGSKTVPETSGFRSPEEEELQRKQRELENLQSELAESELELATLRSELIAFERRYLEVVGSRYAELDALEARIAESVARSRPTDPSARQKAESARTRAEESEEAMGDVGREDSAPGFAPSDELKALYRQAAKELHPDLTTDEEERERRRKAMAELNRAYEECDEERIRQILAEWRSSPEQVRGDDTAAQLVRAIREIAQVHKRLEAIKAEIEELAQGELHRLMKQVQEAATRGQDLLAVAQRFDWRCPGHCPHAEFVGDPGVAGHRELFRPNVEELYARTVEGPLAEHAIADFREAMRQAIANYSEVTFGSASVVKTARMQANRSDRRCGGPGGTISSPATLPNWKLPVMRQSSARGDPRSAVPRRAISLEGSRIPNVSVRVEEARLAGPPLGVPPPEPMTRSRRSSIPRPGFPVCAGRSPGSLTPAPTPRRTCCLPSARLSG